MSALYRITSLRNEAKEAVARASSSAELEQIRVRYQDEQGHGATLDADGYLSRAIQHEVDHLDGVLFVERLSALKRQFLRRALDALARGELPEGYAPPLTHGQGGAI